MCMVEKEIRFFTHARSGSHAITQWIIDFHKGPSMATDQSIKEFRKRLVTTPLSRLARSTVFKGYTKEEAFDEIVSICNNTLDGAKKKKLFINRAEYIYDFEEWIRLMDSGFENIIRGGLGKETFLTMFILLTH